MGAFEHGNATSRSTKGGKFDYLREFIPLEKECAPFS